LTRRRRGGKRVLQPTKVGGPRKLDASKSTAFFQAIEEKIPWLFEEKGVRMEVEDSLLCNEKGKGGRGKPSS